MTTKVINIISIVSLLVISIASLVVPSPAHATTGLVAVYSFHEGPRTTLIDPSDNGSDEIPSGSQITTTSNTSHSDTERKGEGRGCKCNYCLMAIKKRPVKY